MRAWGMAFSMQTATPELLQRMKRTADEHGVGLTIHHSSGATIIEKARAELGTTPTEYLERLGVLGPNVLLAHCVGLADAEMDAIARTGASVTTCPVRDMKEAAGVGQNCRALALLERGVPVVMGSDSANSSNHLDSIRNANMLAVQFKDAFQDMRKVPAEQAVEAITLNGAKAFGQGHELGSIEAGKKADLVLFDTRRPEWQALFNPVNNLVYNADGRSVDTVIVDGRIVLEGGRQTFVDAERLYDQIQAIGESLQARTGITFPRSRWPIV
jgi:cytosine/adenosine deaminase-related metal-dependent hydrolase